MSETRETLFPARSETTWELAAKGHKDAEEWFAARLAADVADAIRFYRLHLESRAK